MKEIPLSKGQVAIVDDGDYEWLAGHKWYALWNPDTRSFYAVRGDRSTGRQRTIYMHREILGLAHGDKRKGDHEDHNTLNDQRLNLRRASHGQNQCNQRKRSDNKSGFKGVCWSREKNLYLINIRFQGKTKHLGYRSDPAVGARLYDEAAIRIFGEFACTNFPKEQYVNCNRDCSAT